MNKARRAELDKALAETQGLAEQLSSLKETLEQIKDDEQEYYNNMPESLQGGAKGDAAQSVVSALENAIENLGDMDEVINYIEEAKGC